MQTCLPLSSAAFLSASACSALSKAFSLSSFSICIFFLMASMATYFAVSCTKYETRNWTKETSGSLERLCRTERQAGVWALPDCTPSNIYFRGGAMEFFWTSNTFLETTSTQVLPHALSSPWAWEAIRCSQTYNRWYDYIRDQTGLKTASTKTCVSNAFKSDPLEDISLEMYE